MQTDSWIVTVRRVGERCPEIFAVFGEENFAHSKIKAAPDDVIDSPKLDSIGLAARVVVKFAAIVAVVAVGTGLPPRMTRALEIGVAQPDCHARSLALVDNGHLKIAYQHIVRKGAVCLHGPYIVVVVGLAAVGDGELVLVDLDEMRGLD